MTRGADEVAVEVSHERRIVRDGFRIGQSRLGLTVEVAGDDLVGALSTQLGFGSAGSAPEGSVTSEPVVSEYMTRGDSIVLPIVAT